MTIVDFGSSDGGAGSAHGGAHGHGQDGAREHGEAQGHGLRGHGRAGRGHSAVAANRHTARNLGGGLVSLLTDAGFADAREVEHLEHRYGPITFVQATRP